MFFPSAQYANTKTLENEKTEQDKTAVGNHEGIGGKKYSASFILPYFELLYIQRKKTFYDRKRFQFLAMNFFFNKHYYIGASRAL